MPRVLIYVFPFENVLWKVQIFKFHCTGWKLFYSYVHFSVFNWLNKPYTTAMHVPILKIDPGSGQIALQALRFFTIEKQQDI